MRRLFLSLLALTSISLACTTMNSADLINQSINVLAGDCLYVLDWNTTITSPNVTQNLIINMAAGENQTDSVSNNTYICDYDMLNIEMTLGFSTNYTETNHNISIRAPDFPKINEVVNISAGQDYELGTYNFTAHCLYQKKDTNINLSYGGKYQDENENLSIGCPLTIDNYHLSCGEAKSYPIGIVVTAPQCINIDKTLNFGDSSDYEADGNIIHIRAPQPLNRNVSLSNNESFYDDNYKINATCQTTEQDFIDYARNLNNTPITELWEKINITENYTCQNLAYVCLDGLTQQCTNDEKFSGMYGFIICYNRRMNEMCIDTLDRYNTCHSELIALNKTFTQGENTANANNDSILLIFGGTMGLVGIVFLTVWYIDRKNAQRGAT